MFNIKSTLIHLIVFAAILGLVFAIGCGKSRETQQMSDFLQQYSKTIDEYSDVINKHDDSQKAKLEEKLKSYNSKWTEMKIEMGEEVTPQTLNKLDAEYQAISKKYNQLAGKS
jgi:hypothetical protein